MPKSQKLTPQNTFFSCLILKNKFLNNLSWQKFLPLREFLPRELELKLEHCGTHTTFLDLAIKTEDGVFVSKLFNKRDKFPFFIVRIRHFESNTSSTIFYDFIFAEYVRIATSTLKLEQFLLRASELYSKMFLHGANQSCINKLILKNFQRYPDVFNSLYLFDNKTCTWKRGH